MFAIKKVALLFSATLYNSAKSRPRSHYRHIHYAHVRYIVVEHGSDVLLLTYVVGGVWIVLVSYAYTLLRRSWLHGWWLGCIYWTVFLSYYVIGPSDGNTPDVM